MTEPKWENLTNDTCYWLLHHENADRALREIVEKIQLIEHVIVSIVVIIYIWFIRIYINNIFYGNKITRYNWQNNKIQMAWLSG